MGDQMTKCNYCGGETVLTSGGLLYPNSLHLYDNLYYHCKSCDAWVGQHPVTGKPLGTLANKELRAMRGMAHKAFDPFWEENRDRAQAYSWLARQLKIPATQCHIGMFDIETCQKVIDICKNARQYKREAEEKARKRNEKLARRAEKRKLKAKE